MSFLFSQIPSIPSDISLPFQWLFILLTIDNVLHWSGLSDVDPMVAAEVALKLALVLESRASAVARSNNDPVLPTKTVGIVRRRTLSGVYLG